MYVAEDDQKATITSLSFQDLSGEVYNISKGAAVSYGRGLLSLCLIIGWAFHISSALRHTQKGYEMIWLMN